MSTPNLFQPGWRRYMGASTKNRLFLRPSPEQKPLTKGFFSIYHWQLPDWREKVANTPLSTGFEPLAINPIETFRKGEMICAV